VRQAGIQKAGLPHFLFCLGLFVKTIILSVLVLSWPIATSLAAQPSPAPGKEDWSTPALANSSLKIEEVIGGERDDYPAFTREMFQLTWRQGDPIYLFLILPKNHPKPPVILYLYSYPSDTDRFLNDDFCEFLAKDGFAAAGFVSALTGQR
jgi:hypothetical protein